MYKVEKYIKIIKSLIEPLLSNQKSNTFDNLVIKIENYIEGNNAHNMLELKDKANDKKKKGNLFEAFCYLYVKNILQHDEVWFYSEIPDEIREKLNLAQKRDMGIDLISKEDNKYFAIQCKYRKPKDQIQTVPWKELSTFYGLVNITGPWERHITMTNINGCCHIMGNKTKKDWSICLGTFKNLNKFKWLQLIDKQGFTSLNEEDEDDENEENKSDEDEEDEEDKGESESESEDDEDEDGDKSEEDEEDEEDEENKKKKTIKIVIKNKKPLVECDEQKISNVTNKKVIINVTNKKVITNVTDKKKVITNINNKKSTNKKSTSKYVIPDTEELRQKRLLYFEKKDN